MTQAFTTIRQNIGKLTLAEKIDVLKWFFDPGRNDPDLGIPEAVGNELHPAAEQFQRMYVSIMAAVDAYGEIDADYIAELRRRGQHTRADMAEARI